MLDKPRLENGLIFDEAFFAHLFSEIHEIRSITHANFIHFMLHFPIPQYKEPSHDQSLLLCLLLVTDDAVCTGFKEGEWRAALNV